MDKHLTTAKYVFYMTDAMKEIVDHETLAALVFGIEACYKKYGPAPSLYTEFQRDGDYYKKDAYINATALSTYFSVKAGQPPSPMLTAFTEHKDFRHNVNHIVGGDQGKYAEVVAKIRALTTSQFMFIVDHAEKFAGDTGVPVPVYYYKKEGDYDYMTVYISPTRFLDQPINVPEAQFKLVKGLTENYSWTIRPEHRPAFEALVPMWLAKWEGKDEGQRAAFARALKKKWEELGDKHYDAESFAYDDGARALLALRVEAESQP